MSTQRLMDCNEHDDSVVSIAVSKIHGLDDIPVVLGFTGKRNRYQMTKPGNDGEHQIVKTYTPYHMGCNLRSEVLFGTYSHLQMKIQRETNILEHKNDQKNRWDRMA